MALAKVFKNRVPNCKVFTPAGRQITFHHGKHITQIQKDIEYLESLVAENDAYVFIDPNEYEIDTEDLTPEGMIKKLKREAVEEYLAAQAAASAQNSTSKQGELGAGTSKTVTPQAVDSNGPATVVPPKAAEPIPEVTVPGVTVNLKK